MYNHLSSKGFDVELVMPKQGNLNVNLCPPLSEIRSILLPRTPGMSGFVLTNILIARMILQKRPDVVITDHGFMLAVMLAKLFRKYCAYLDVRSIPVETSTLRERANEALFYLAVNIPIWYGATFITSATERIVKERAPWVSRLATGIWSSGVDTSRFRPDMKERIRVRTELALDDKFAIVYCGSFSRNRALLETIDALAINRKIHGLNMCLLLVGEGSSRDDILTRVAKRGLQNEVTIYPQMSQTEVIRLLQAMDAGIDPLPDLLWWRVSSPLKVLEFAATGLLLILTDIDAHRQFKDCAFYAKDTSPEELALAMRNAMMTSEEERFRRIATGMAIAKESSWERRAEEFARFLYRARQQEAV